MAATPTELKAVTVHRNGALCVRTGTAGVSRVRVTGLPLLLNSDSIRIRPERGAALDVRELYALESQAGGPPPDASALREAEDEEARLVAEAGVLAVVGKSLEAMRPAAAKDVPGLDPAWMPDVAGWLDFQAEVSRRLTALDQERRALAARLVDVRGRVAQMRFEVSQRSGLPARTTRGIEFSLAGADGEVPFELEYFVSAARWVPTYRLSLSGASGVFTLGALVAQASGETWSNVTLSFSTADLARDNTLPELASWRMGRAQPAPRPAFRPLPNDLEGLFAGLDAHRRSHPVVEVVQAPTPVAAPPPAPPTPPPLPPPRAAPMAKPAAAPRPSAPAASMPAMARRVGGAEMAKERRSAVAAERDDAMTFGSAGPEEAEESGFDDGEATGEVALGGGGGPPGRGGLVGGAAAPAEPEPVPRMRHAYLRLKGPDEGDRGTLRAVHPVEQVKWLLLDHGGDAVDTVLSAVSSLRTAARNLSAVPLPAGTTGLELCGFHHVYGADGRHDIPSDATWHGVTVRSLSAAVSFEHRAVPRESLDVYRFCQMPLPANLPLPSGPVQVFVDGAFRVNTTLRGTGGVARLDVNLGVDPDVRIQGRVTHVKQEEKGLMSQSTRVEHEVRMDVMFTLAIPATLVLMDRLPVPLESEKDITVALGNSQPPAQKTDRAPDGSTLKGGHAWRLELSPRSQSKVTYTYTITLPAKSELVGGNRRE